MRYIRLRAPETVTLVRMGHEARESCDEDDLCAELLRSAPGRRADGRCRRTRALRGAPSAQKFFDPACDWAPERDFELCTRVDAFDFVLRLEQGEEPAQLRRIDVA